MRIVSWWPIIVSLIIIAVNFIFNKKENRDMLFFFARDLCLLYKNSRELKIEEDYDEELARIYSPFSHSP